MVKNTDKGSIRTLLEGCMANNRKSQELLYKQYYGFAMSICLRYAKNKDEALETLNDAFLKVFNNVGKFDFQRPFNGWFKRIVVNTAIDSYRANNKFQFNTDIETAYAVKDESESVIDKLSFDELLSSLSILPAHYRTTFNLFVFEGMSHEEIGNELGISIGTSKSNLSRARDILKKHIANNFNITKRQLK